MNNPPFPSSDLATLGVGFDRLARTWAGLVLGLGLLATAAAQQVVMSTPEQPLVAPIMRPPPAAAEAASSTTTFQAFPTGPSIAVGEFKLQPHLLASVLHANGLPVQSSSTRVSSDIYTFAPGLLADLGRYWTTDYTATARNYSAAELRDSVDHNIRLVGANQSPDWRLQLTESYSVASSLLVETARQTKQKVWTNTLSVGHNFGNLLRYQGTAGYTKADNENFSEVGDWATEHWLRGTVSPRVEAGFGFGLGYSDIVARPNTYYEQYLGEVIWRPTDKVNLSLQGGWQDRHSLSAAVGSERNPILQASLGWRPFDQTNITVTSSRAVANTLAGDGVATRQAWGVALNQRLLGKLSLLLGYNGTSADYRTNTGGQLNGRADEVRSFNTSLSIVVFSNWTVAATYQHSKNDANLAGFSYTSSQYGLSLSGRF